MKATQTATTSNENVNNKGVTDMDQSTKTKEIERTVTPYVTKTNNAYKRVRNASSALFNSIKDARRELKSEEWELYRDAIEVDKSTLNKIVKICGESTILENLERLPVSWMTLYEIVQLINDKSDVQVREWIAEGKIHSKSPKSAISDLRKESSKESESGDETANSKEVRETCDECGNEFGNHAETCSQYPKTSDTTVGVKNALEPTFEPNTIYVDYRKWKSDKEIEEVQKLLNRLSDFGFNITPYSNLVPDQVGGPNGKTETILVETETRIAA